MTNLIRQTNVPMSEAKYFSLYFALLFTVEITIVNCRLLSEYNMEIDINESTQANKLQKMCDFTECF